ncbi:hypothetical protein FRB91_003579 [Serendipita sp. 411]|nr:hypothetical protein FRB91_003579 [Serendipita sp. 411]
MLSQLDSVTSRGYIEGVRSQVQQVDEGFEEIRRMLDNQRHALRDYFDAQKIPIAPAKRKSDPLSEPVPPDNSGSVRSLSDSLTNSPNLPRAIEAGKEALSQVRAVVGKARYTKARKTIEDKLSTTTSQLEKLYCVSQEYALKVQGLSTPQSALQTKWWNRWCGPSHQLLNLVKTMINRLMEVQRGFDKYKRSILGLIFRPLGDMIEDLKPYCSQVGQEVITKELHADMILYEAAFLFLLKSWSKPLGLAEQIDECKSRLEATVYRV